MQRTALLLAAAPFLLLLSAGPANAAIITFDDLTTRESFFNLGIQGTYHGFDWGYSTSGPAGAVIPTTSSTGWASATVSDPALSPAPTPVSGSSYAWTYNGAQSLFIDFHTPHDVAGGYFATLSSAYSSNASTVQMFGYDGSNNLLASSGVLSLTHTFQLLSSNFAGVTTLEIRSDGNTRWFSVDNLDVSPSAVPEPATLTLFGAAALTAGYFGLRRRKPAAA